MKLLHEMLTSHDADAILSALLCLASLIMFSVVVLLSFIGCQLSADANKLKPTPKRFLKAFVACYEEFFGGFACIAGLILCVINISSISPRPLLVTMTRIALSAMLALLGGYLARCGIKRGEELLRFQSTLTPLRPVQLDRVVSSSSGK